MSNSTRPVPRQQAQDFHLAVCKRLGVDPAIVSASDFDVVLDDGDGNGSVTLTAHLPAEELRAMFNAAGRR